MSSKKKKAGKKNNLPKNDSTAVNLTRRELCNGYIDALTPQNVTNSRKSDGGWMDSIGVHNAGLGHLFEATADPMDKYISNNVSIESDCCVFVINVQTLTTLFRHMRDLLLQTYNMSYILHWNCVGTIRFSRVSTDPLQGKI